MSKPIDVAIGVTVICSAVLAVVRGRAPASAGFALMALHLMVGYLFIVRREPVREGSWRQHAMCLLSVPMPMLAYSLAPPLASWPVQALALLGLGSAGAMMSLCALGRSFAILPALRGVVHDGPFRVVRHPLYASELLMVSACLTARAETASLVVGMATLVAVVVRIRVEEDVMSQEKDYGTYSRRVRFRLIPLLW